jgi:hypothetical protein
LVGFEGFQHKKKTFKTYQRPLKMRYAAVLGLFVSIASLTGPCSQQAADIKPLSTRLLPAGSCGQH